MIKAKNIMTQPVITAREDTTLEQVAQSMLKHRIGCVPVVDREGRICGIITESDFTEKEKCVPFSTFRAPQLFGEWVSPEGVERVYRAARQIGAREIMSRPVATVLEDDSVHEVMARMVRHDVNRIPVLRDQKPVGIIARHDLLKMMVANSAGA
jgi:CBS domain-containing protein